MSYTIDIDHCLSLLKEERILPEKDLRQLCEMVKELLIEESNVQPVSAPVIVCGDIHGQYYDLLELFNVGGQIPNKNYIFIGDFVDRGYNSVETFEYLMCLKVKYPQCISLIRGNHETRQVTSVYGFYDEILRKYGNINPWKYCTEVFDHLIIGALIEGKILCIHGGLSPEIRTIDQIRTIDRKVEIPHEGSFSDLVWSDPDEIEGFQQSPRGAGWLFGSKVTSEFNHLNGLTLICRAHQLVQEGIKFWFEKQNLATVWSAPNYCYRCGNLAAILEFDDDLNYNHKQFKEVERSCKSVNPKNVLPYFL